jgi:hypothetical protein
MLRNGFANYRAKIHKTRYATYVKYEPIELKLGHQAIIESLSTITLTKEN